MEERPLVYHLSAPKMHGRPRQSLAADPARQKHEEAKIANLESLQAVVLKNHRERSYSQSALQQNARLLEMNPEVYTAWNYRKLAVQHLLESAPDDTERKFILEDELQLVEKALKRNPKSYGAWFHRKWVLRFGLSSLDREFQLLGKLLDADPRNFNAWSYRRFVAVMKQTTEEQELQFTIKKINENFSNYSAWHNRSVLLSKQFNGKLIEKDRQQEILTQEYELVKQAFFTEPEDQSGWFYLLWLLSQSVTPSGPLLTGVWPSNGSLIILNSDVPPKPCFWSFKAPPSRCVCFDHASLLIALCFSEPVLGVDSTTIRMVTSPEVQGFDSGVSWSPISESTEGSRIWTANVVGLCMVLKALAIYTIHVEVGANPGITSKNGAFVGVKQISFSIEVQAISSGICLKAENLDSSITWPDECTEQYASNSKQLMEDLVNGYHGVTNISPDTTAEWQLMTLEAQMDTCRELLDVEKNSKWAKLTLARLLIAHDNLVNSLNTQKQHDDEVKQIFTDLMALDPTHHNYYDEQISLLQIDQISRTLQNLSGHWWESKKFEDKSEGWLRFNHFSLSKIGYFERLMWVQRLDLSHNKLQSLEGLEPLQHLVFLDVSNNLLSNATALGPLRLTKNLQALNIKHNKIGGHTIDTHRYSFPSALSNSIATSDYPIILYSWETVAVFRGMALRQLEIFGNPIANDNMYKNELIQALPSLIWLDGERVSL